jgi:hypothetical protein
MDPLRLGQRAARVARARLSRGATPADNPQSLAPDEVYALTAYILYLNGIVPEEAVMDAQSLPQVVMPNHAGFTSPDPRPDVFNAVAGGATPIATPTA